MNCVYIEIQLSCLVTDNWKLDIKIRRRMEITKFRNVSGDKNVSFERNGLTLNCYVIYKLLYGSE